ncbi:MAG: tRNA guanosine(34) transglycosylase Tgt [Patescibacteria group bacterium]
MFKLLKKSKKSQARLGELETVHGIIKTPFFMPIATKGSVKSLDSSDILNLRAQIILSNTYHLYLQPGLKVLKKFKGLHNFMNWQKPILTDSGGYQVFSLSNKTRNGKSLRKISKKGVEFRSFIDGSKHIFTPAKVQEIQDIIGSDIKMVLDVCSPHPCTKKQAEKDLELTHLWADKSLEYHKKSKSKKLIFGIIQGSIYKDLRLASAKFLSSLHFDGLAIGGLAVGESNDIMYKTLDYLVPEMPENKPRYLMGVGKPENIVESVKRGIDMFDCVIPTREARHGRLYVFTTNDLKNNFYKIININNAKYKNSTQPINDSNLKNYTLGYLHHLFKAQEPLALRFATLNNVKFYLDLMADLRVAINGSKL